LLEVEPGRLNGLREEQKKFGFDDVRPDFGNIEWFPASAGRSAQNSQSRSLSSGFNIGGTLFGSIVPLGRGYFSHDPGTSCLATIMLFLRDKNHSPIEAPRIILALMD
jgi:hypothetical protein